MAAIFQEYKISLKGINSTDFYIKKLQKYKGSQIIIEREKAGYIIQFIAPIKKITNLDEIESDIAKREKDLKWDVPELRKSVAKDIDRTFQAEQIVNEGSLSIRMPDRIENVVAEVMLAVMPVNDPLIMNICGHYAFIRILEVANALDMMIEGNIVKL